MIALLLALILSAGAQAATWSKPHAYDRAPCHPASRCVLEPAPRVAVNGRGTAVAAWIDTRRRVRVAVATRPGHFGAAATLGAHALRPAVAIGPDGTMTVV